MARPKSKTPTKEEHIAIRMTKNNKTYLLNHYGSVQVFLDLYLKEKEKEIEAYIKKIGKN